MFPRHQAIILHSSVYTLLEISIADRNGIFMFVKAVLAQLTGRAKSTTISALQCLARFCLSGYFLTSNTMPNVQLNADIIHYICQYFSCDYYPSVLACMARARRSYTEPALAALWSRIPNFDYIFLVLGPEYFVITDGVLQMVCSAVFVISTSYFSCRPRHGT
jgi:hypothetical protein